jgi:hypothetical protein
VAGKIGSDQTSSANLAAGSDTTYMDVLWTPTLADVASSPHIVYFCADVPKPGAVSESNENNNCANTGSFSIISPAFLPWLQTTGGDVGSLGSPTAFNMQKALTAPDYNASYSVFYNGTNTNFTSAKNWLVHPYAPNLGSYKTYGDFDKPKFTANRCTYTDSIPGSSNLPSEKGVYLHDYTSLILLAGNVPKSRSDLGCGSAPTTKDAIVVFVHGNLIIYGWPTVPIPIVLIVSGSVSIKPAVSSINAMIIADKSFTTFVSPTHLVVTGGVLAALNPQPADPLPSVFNLNRDTGGVDTTTPAEKFVYDPKYLWYLTDYLGVAKTTYSEARP